MTGFDTASAGVPRGASKVTISKRSRFGIQLSRRGKAVLAVVLGAAAFALGSALFGFAAVLPLLYLLPCAAMLFFCHKGMSKQAADGHGAACTSRNTGTHAPQEERGTS